MAEEIRKITLGLVISWIFGVLFGLSGILFISEGSIGAGVPLIIASFVMLPPLNKLVKDKLNFELSGGLKTIVVIILFGIYVVNSPLSDLSAPSTDILATDEASEIPKAESVKEVEVPKVYNFGDQVIVSDFAYTIHSMDVKNEIGVYLFGDFMGAKPDGVFVILDVTIENIGKESKYILGSNIKIIDEEERRYNHDASAEIYLEEKAFSFVQMQPGLPKRGSIVFDVPQDIMGLIEISSDSLLSNEKKYVSLKG